MIMEYEEDCWLKTKSKYAGARAEIHSNIKQAYAADVTVISLEDNEHCYDSLAKFREDVKLVCEEFAEELAKSLGVCRTDAYLAIKQEFIVRRAAGQDKVMVRFNRIINQEWAQKKINERAEAKVRIEARKKARYGKDDN